MKTCIQKVVFHLGTIRDSLIFHAAVEAHKAELLPYGLWNSPALCDLWDALRRQKSLKNCLAQCKQELQGQDTIRVVLLHFSHFCQYPELLPAMYDFVGRLFPEADLQAFFSFCPQVEARRAKIFWNVFYGGQSLCAAISDTGYKKLYDYRAGIDAMQRIFSRQKSQLYMPDSKDCDKDALNAFLHFAAEGIVAEEKYPSISPTISFAVSSSYLQLREQYNGMKPTETVADIHAWFEQGRLLAPCQPFPLFESEQAQHSFLRHYLEGNITLAKLAGKLPVYAEKTAEEFALLPPADNADFSCFEPSFVERLQKTLPVNAPLSMTLHSRKKFIKLRTIEEESGEPFTMLPSKAKLCVLTLTYNHKAFIKDAMESVIQQKTDFPIAHIIADDGSDDGTADILLDYARRYRHIVPFLQPHRTYGQKNIRDLFEMATGCPYVSLCDGDDYFTDPLKLQKQVDFLEQNPDHALCFHPVRVVYEDKQQNERVYPPLENMPRGVRSSYYLADMLKANMIQTNSVVYRWRFKDGLPLWFDTTLLPGDWYWHILHAEMGKIGFLPEIMSVYRRHSGSVFDSANGDHVHHRLLHGLKELQLYDTVNKHFKGRYYRSLARLATGVLADFVETYIKTGDDSLINQASILYPDFTKDFLAKLQLVPCVPS